MEKTFTFNFFKKIKIELDTSTGCYGLAAIFEPDEYHPEIGFLIGGLVIAFELEVKKYEKNKTN